MKTKIVLILLAGISFMFSSCERHQKIRPSAHVSEKTTEVSGFSKVEISHAFNAYITIVPGKEQVTIEANENLHPYIEVNRHGSKLQIGLRNNVNIRGSATLIAYISANELDGLQASGASNIYLENVLETYDCDIDLSGASSIQGTLFAIDLDCSLSGASSVKVDGEADYLYLDASGASSFTNFDFVVNQLSAELSGASEAELAVNHRIDIEASGASELTYTGDATIHRQNLSGASEVRWISW